MVGIKIGIHLGRGGAAVIDTVPPEITNAALDGEDLTMDMSKAGTAYWLMNQSATILTGAAIKAAVIAMTPDLYGTKVCTVGSNTVPNISLTSLAAGTWYLHIVAQNSGGYLDDFGDVVTVEVSAAAWDLSRLSYASKSFSVTAQEVTPGGVFFKPDGLSMYVVGEGSDWVRQYTLGTAWDVTTASYTSGINISARDSTPNDLWFSSDGSKMFTIGNQNNSVYEWGLSTPWLASSATWTSTFAGISETSPFGLTFSDDGAFMYRVGNASDDVTQFTLSTPWLLSSASLTRSFSVAAKETTPQAVGFGNSGAIMYVMGSISGQVHAYDLSTPWNISTAVFSQSKTVSTEDTVPRGMFWKPDGTKMYMCGDTTDSVYQYEVV